MALKESIETIYTKASEAAQIAAKKTRKLAEIAKTNLTIYGQEDQIKKAYMELGKLYYRDYVVGEDQDEAEYLPLCQKIDECKQTIADLRDYIEILKTEHVEFDPEEGTDITDVVEETTAEAE